MSINLYPHQAYDYNILTQKIQNNRRVIFMAATGYGKGVVIPWTAKHLNLGKTLVLCHREVLVDQLIGNMALLGMTSEKIVQKTRKLHHKSDCYVGMIETVYNRFLKNPNYLKDVGLIICDEAHRLEFIKLFEYFPNAKIIGFTATPVLSYRDTYFKCNYCKTEYPTLTECCHQEVAEYSRPRTMSKYYDDIVVGASIEYLIEHGFLVQDVSICKTFDDTSLKQKNGEFTTESLDEVFDTDEAKYDVIKHYEEYAKGKKTIIFNSSINANQHLLEEFKKAGYENVQSDDSRNPNPEIISWFKKTPDAILLNVDKYTAGMDVTDIECVILNRATLSLSLYLQMVGRGGRSTKLIPKDHFILIDLGGNVKRHLEWSDPSRDWERIFFKGVGEDKPKKQALEQITDCENCGMLMPRTQKKCPECGYEEPEKQRYESAEEEVSDVILQPLRKTPPPNGEAIYKYVKHIEKDINYALNTVLVDRIVDMFITHRVNAGTIEKTIENGKFEERVKANIQRAYFVLVKKKDIIPENWQGRTINTLVERVKNKLKKRYGIQETQQENN